MGDKHIKTMNVQVFRRLTNKHGTPPTCKQCLKIIRIGTKYYPSRSNYGNSLVECIRCYKKSFIKL